MHLPLLRPRDAYQAGTVAPRRGSSYLEVQVAMVMLSIGMAGLYSMSVVQTRQTSRLTEILPAAQPAALNQAGHEWARKLGVYASVETTVVPSAPVANRPIVDVVIDNQDPGATFHKGSSDWYGWTSWNYYRAYLGNARYHYSFGRSGSWAELRATGLAQGDYEVYVSYPNLGSFGRAIPHRVYDGITLLETVNVDQRVAPADFSHNGRMWRLLGVYPINSGQVRLRMMDGPNSRYYIICDAMLVRTRRPLRVLSVAETGGGGATATLEPTP